MKKVLSIIKATITWLLVIAAVFMMIFTVISVNTFDRNDRDLFGYKAYIVKSDSMSTLNGDESKGYFDAGDLILVKEVDPSTLKEGDIISYISTNTESFGETVTHMIREITTDDEGNSGFITYGTSTGTNDANVVTHTYVLGKYESKIPFIGKFFAFLKTTPGYIVCIFLPFLLLILVQGFNSIRLFRKYKAEQMAEIEAQREKERAELEAERAAMAEERKRQEEMMQKLLEMQAMMQKNVTTEEAEENSMSCTTASSEDNSSEQ